MTIRGEVGGVPCVQAGEQANICIELCRQAGDISRMETLLRSARYPPPQDRHQVRLHT